MRQGVGSGGWSLVAVQIGSAGGLSTGRAAASPQAMQQESNAVTLPKAASQVALPFTITLIKGRHLQMAHNFAYAVCLLCRLFTVDLLTSFFG